MIDRTVLIVDDNVAMCENMEDIVRENNFTPFSAHTCASALELAKERQPMIALLDLKLPDGLGTTLLADLKRMIPRCACIIMTAYADVDSAVSALENGAFHYLNKPVRPAELLQLLERAFTMIRLEEEKQLTENALRTSEEQYRTLVENLNVGVYRCCSNQNASFIQVNPAMHKIFGHETTDELLHCSLLDFLLEQTERETFFAQILQPGGVKDKEIACRKKDGEPIWVSCTATAQYDDNGQLKWVDGIVEDITDRKKLESQLRHTQKMEAISTLAGGVAHDFNNILTAIAGNATLFKMKLAEGDALAKYADNILTSSEKAAAITRRLLTFSRKQFVDLSPASLNHIVMAALTPMNKLLGINIELLVNLSDEELTIMANREQIEQVLIDVVANAHGAMPNGGQLAIRTSRMELSGDYAYKHGYGKPGSYALLSVSDTGSGIDKQTLERIFEPFFTSDGIGKGTGLGLSIAYGIIKQHNGYINSYSELGEGTTLKIYIPLIADEPTISNLQEQETSQRGTETILLADDDAEVREFEQDILRQFGYTVIEAVDGNDAVAKFRQSGNNIQLAILDIIMPGRNGKEVHDEMLKTQPDMKVLFTSGYTDDILGRKGIIKEGMAFCSKPVAPEEFIRKVRETLDK